MRWNGTGCITPDGCKVVYSEEHHFRGVGAILDSETSKAIKGFSPVSDRVIIVKLQGKPLDIGLIQLYAPSVDSIGGGA